MPTIPLTQGQVTVVDEETYDLFGSLKWFCCNGYAARVTRISDDSRRTVLLHRLVALARPEEHIHHLDGNPLNNLPDNLQKLSRSDHMRRHNLARSPRVKYRGIAWRKRIQQWEASIQMNGQTIYLGYYPTPEEAALVYDHAARYFWGEDAYQNFP